jgi:hypothetical protein
MFQPVCFLVTKSCVRFETLFAILAPSSICNRRAADRFIRSTPTRNRSIHHTSFLGWHRSRQHTKMQKGIPAKTCYAILRKQREQSCAFKTSLVLDATGKHSLTFSSMAEASAWIRMMKTRKGPDDMTFSPVEVGGHHRPSRRRANAARRRCHLGAVQFRWSASGHHSEDNTARLWDVPTR